MRTVTLAVTLRHVAHAAASTGLPTKPVPGAPWLMEAGSARAHIMFAPTM